MPRTLADWLTYIERQHPRSIDMGLDRVRAVAGRMELARPARRVITVAGTNGKGSTVAFIEAIARAVGWRVGAYTSPHLFAYNERVRIDGRDADDSVLVDAFETVEAARLSASPSGRGLREAQGEGKDLQIAGLDGRGQSTPSSVPAGHLPPEGEGKAIPLTYFEYGTLAALWLFQRSALDLAILEVGLGGRLDAVNLVDADVAVITTVDLDHQDYLGSGRERIGFEKAGIARPSKPLLLGEADPPSSVLGHADAIGATTRRIDHDFFIDNIDAGHWRWRDTGHAIELPMPQLAAPAQLRNAATSIAALRALDASIADGACVEGVVAARLPGRLQRMVCDGVEIVVDVGHNPQAAREVTAWLRATPVDGRTYAVYAALHDKDLAGVVAALSARVDGWFLAGLEQAGPRGLAIAEFAQRLAGTAAGAGSPHADIAHALAAARAAATTQDRILVFGSFHTAAAALDALGARGS